MTDKEIVERAKKAEKRTCFGELVHSPISKGVNSAFGIGFIEGMAEYRNSLQEEPVSEDSIIMYGMSASVGLEEAVKNRDEYKEWQGFPDIQKEFIDFAKFGNQYKEPVSEDLEEAAKYYIPDESYHMIIESKEEGSGENVYDYVQMIDMFKAGAQWQKEQMMKSVLASQEMTCIQVAHRLIGSSWNLACPTDKIGLKSNDKVKVIIIKD